MSEEKKKDLLKTRRERDKALGNRVSDSTESPQERSSRLPEKILGAKYVRLLEKLVRTLRDSDPAHGNRSLFLDDVFVVYLLAFFNPLVRSLRTLEDLSQTQHAQRHLVPRTCLADCRSTTADLATLCRQTSQYRQTCC